MKTNRVRKDSKAASRRRQLKVPSQSGGEFLEVAMPDNVVALIDQAARSKGQSREEFIRESIQEKIEAASAVAATDARQVWQNMEQTNYDAIALIWMLMESYENQLVANTGSKFAGPILSGLQTMARGVRARLLDGHEAMANALRAAKGGAR